MMAESRRCNRCGIELFDDAPAGLCPRCLVQAGFEDSEASDIPDNAAQPTVKSPVGSGPSFEPPLPEEIAALFPQLEILKLLGHGGMGAVYQARQTKLDRLVALKIIRPEAADDPAFAERFNREARTLARLSHPNIVAVHDFGETPARSDPIHGVPAAEADQSGEDRMNAVTTNLYYFVMEYVDGANLRELIHSSDLEPEQALAIIPQICEGLQFAHDAGVVHRDIKPENILLDQSGRVKIADFGLAKLAAPSPEDFTLTATHQVMGTPRYMAPEQMEGSRSVDHRADIYSLGVVLYEMLTGEVPAGHFEPPSRKVSIDVRLDEVVLRAMAREPERRFQHASELKSSVESISSESGQHSVTPGHPAGPSTILDREVIGAWRWVTRDPATTQQQVPMLLMILLCLAGCATVALPWLELTVTDRLVTDQLDSTQLVTVGYLPAWVQTWNGMDNWPGLVAAGAFGLLGVLALAIPAQQRLTLTHAVAMTLLAAAAVLHVVLFKLDIESGRLHIPGSSIAYHEIVHQFRFRSGFFCALGLSLFALLFSGAAIRHALTDRRSVGTTAHKSDSGTPLANVRFTVPARDDAGSLIIFHFSGLGYELTRQSPGVWVLQRGSSLRGMMSSQLRDLHTTLTVRSVSGPDDELLISCAWSVRTLGAWISRKDIRKLKEEGHELEALLRTGHVGSTPLQSQIGQGVSPGTKVPKRHWDTRNADSVQAPATSVRTSLSRAAIAGMVQFIAVAALAAAGGLFMWIQESQWAAAGQREFRWAILGWPIGAVLLAGMVATVCGYVALVDIRQSAGRRIGLGLAFADAAIAPLQFLYGAILGLVFAVAGFPGVTPDPAHHDFVASLVIAAILWCVLTPFLLRRAWRGLSLADYKTDALPHPPQTAPKSTVAADHLQSAGSRRWPVLTLTACVVSMGLSFAPWNQSLLDDPTQPPNTADRIDKVSVGSFPVLASLHTGFIPAAEIVHTGGRPRARIGSVKLDYRLAFSVMAAPRGMLNCWNSSLAFGDPRHLQTQPFVEVPNWMLFFVPLLIAVWGALSARGTAGPTGFRIAALLLGVYAMLQAGMVTCATWEASETLQLPPLLIFVAFCLVILATVAAGVRGVWRFGESLQARTQLRIAAYGLMLTGISAVLCGGVSLMLGMMAVTGLLARESFPPDMAAFSAIMITMALLTAAGACIIIGARRMLRFESYRSAIMTSLIGQPVGLWALWVLMKPEVSDCFVSQRGGETDNSEPRR